MRALFTKFSSTMCTITGTDEKSNPKRDESSWGTSEMKLDAGFMNKYYFSFCEETMELWVEERRHENINVNCFLSQYVI